MILAPPVSEAVAQCLKCRDSGQRWTMPSPKASWVTRSPADRTGTARSGLLVPAARRYEMPPDPFDELGVHRVWSASVRRQSSSSAGISSRNRDGGLWLGAPQALRTIARDRY